MSTNKSKNLQTNSIKIINYLLSKKLMNRMNKLEFKLNSKHNHSKQLNNQTKKLQEKSENNILSFLKNDIYIE